MAIQTEPTRIQIPFADSGTKNVIPDTNSTPSASQAASWTDGFPAQCSLPLSAGGIPPARADFNGIFNTMTQSERFTQEGGIWAWDATVDYGTNRVVLGSDGLLYWSVAQSGPNVGGAQDPTTDAGVYWSTMPMLTPPLADKSSKAATTEWVRDLVVAPVYVDPAGSDSNDGMSAVTAVQTIQKAMDIAATNPASGGFATIRLASGTYTGDISVYNVQCKLSFSGSVVVVGDIALHNSSDISLDGSASDSFSVTGSTTILNSSYFRCGIVPTSFSSSGKPAISLSGASYFGSSADVSLTASNTTYILVSTYGSVFLLADNKLSLDPVSISGTCVFLTGGSILAASSLAIATTAGHTASGALAVYTGSFAAIGNDGITMGSNVGGYSIQVTGCSVVTCSGPAVVYCGARGVSVSENSRCTFSSTIHIVASNSSATAVLVSECSRLQFSGNLTIDAPNGGSTAISATSVSHLAIANVTLTVNNAWSGSILAASGNAYVFVNGSATPAGTATGKRYVVTTGAQVNVQGAGANHIPGSTAGTVNSSQFSYYG